MALIIDLDDLQQSTTQDGSSNDGNVYFDTTNKKIYLLKDEGVFGVNELTDAGLASENGVTIQALYSFCKDQWKNDANLIKYPFPMVAITSEQFEFVNGWTYGDQATVDLFRNGGFAVKNAAGASLEEWMGVITLGTLGATDQVYFQQEVDGAPTDCVLPGVVNQCVQIIDDPNGDGDYADGFDRNNYYKIFVREQAKTYADSNEADIGVSEFTYQAYRFPLANQADLKVTHDDPTAAGYGVTVTYYATNQSLPVGASSYPFRVVIDGNNRTAEEIYEAVQYLLRQNADIDNDPVGTKTGKTAEALLTFVGDTLVTSQGVYIENFQAIDINRLEFYDQDDLKRTFPFVAAGTITFNDNLVLDGAAIYRMYYTSGFGTGSAELVTKENDTPISGTISGSSITFDYDYDNDTAGGGAGIDKNVTVVAIGLNRGQYVLAEGTITRSTQNSIALVAALERNYTNPA